MIRDGRTFLRHLFSILARSSSRHHYIHLDNSARADLRWWACFLRHWCGRSFFYTSTLPSVHVYTDASGSVGCGGILVPHYWFQIRWPVSLAEGWTSLSRNCFPLWWRLRSGGRLGGINVFAFIPTIWPWWQYCEVSRQGTQSRIICYGAFIFTQSGTTSGMTLSTYRVCSTLPLTHYLGITYIYFPLFSHRQSHPWSHSWSPLSCWTITRTGDLRVG